MKTSKSSPTDAIKWISSNLTLTESTAAEFTYGILKSTSHYQWPIIDHPFDGSNRVDFRFHASMLDFFAVVGSGKILDFGCGDGIPSLMIAPYVKEVIGVDSGPQEHKNSIRNMKKLGIRNANFIKVGPRDNLPFASESFDGATAEFSLEAVPDLAKSLKEIARVLRKGGKFRLANEPLTLYKSEPKCIWVIEEPNKKRTRITVFDRDVDGENVTHYGLLLGLSMKDVERAFSNDKQSMCYKGLSLNVLDQLSKHLLKSVMWKGIHPTPNTWRKLLRKAGFSQVEFTYNAGWVADQLFDTIKNAKRLRSLESTHKYLFPIVKTVADMQSVENKCNIQNSNTRITATK